jgi:cytochrome oxidase assembly protein ShyY1
MGFLQSGRRVALAPGPYPCGVLRFLLAPRWLALHLATVAALAGTLFLGSWQMQAYAEQEQREQVAAANLAEDAPVVPIADVVPPGQALPVDAVSRPVTTTGVYDVSQTLLLPGREMDGQPGWHVVTPLVGEDDSITPVLRGWVPDPADPGVVPPSGEVAIRGSVQALETDQDAAVDPTVALSDAELAALTSVALFRTYPYPPARIRQTQVVLIDENPSASDSPTLVLASDAAPRPVGVSAWRHLSYAWQWWLFAAAAVVFWGAFVRAGIREQRAGTRTDQSRAEPGAEPVRS